MEEGSGSGLMLGNSGATIRVVDNTVVEKTGGDVDLHEQAAICRYLGDHVCPKIFRLLPDGYWMENLQETPFGHRMDRGVVLQDIRTLLEKHVWIKQCRYTQSETWGDELLVWCRKNAPWLVDLHTTLYPAPLQDNWCATHGDPTLANTMYREGRRGPILIDPMPPRPAVPSTREVDVGKLLQSLCGWEYVKSTGQEPGDADKNFCHWNELVRSDNKLFQKCCLFWAAVHCARVAARAAPGSTTHVWGCIESVKWGIHAVGV